MRRNGKGRCREEGLLQIYQEVPQAERGMDRKCQRSREYAQERSGDSKLLNYVKQLILVQQYTSFDSRTE